MKLSFSIVAILCLICLNSAYIFGANLFNLFKDTPVYELAMAAQKNDVKKIEELVKSKKFDPDYKEKEFGTTVLMAAIYHGKYKAVEALLKNGANPNIRDNIDKTALMYQVDHTFADDCNTKATELLIKYGADVNAASKFHKKYDPKNPDEPHGKLHTTPFMEACQGACMAKIKLLIAHGADVNKWVGDEGNCALTDALIQARMDVVKFLVIELKVKIPPYWMIDKGDTLSILTLLRLKQFRLGSRHHKTKMEIVRYLKNNYNMDYFKEPVPEGFFLQKIKNEHPKDWEEYIKRY